MNQSRQFCTFFLGDHCFGVPVEQVQEVLRSEAMTPVPLAPPQVRGLINLRGQIVTVIDLRRCLNLPDRDPRRHATNVIVQTGGEITSLLVDEMGNVQNVEEHQCEPPPDNLRGDSRALISQAYKLSDRLLLVLDVAKVVAASGAMA